MAWLQEISEEELLDLYDSSLAKLADATRGIRDAKKKVTEANAAGMAAAKQYLSDAWTVFKDRHTKTEEYKAELQARQANA